MVVEFGILVGGDDERWAACLANLRGELNLDTSDGGEDWVLIFFRLVAGGFDSTGSTDNTLSVRKTRSHQQYAKPW